MERQYKTKYYIRLTDTAVATILYSQNMNKWGKGKFVLSDKQQMADKTTENCLFQNITIQGWAA